LAYGKISFTITRRKLQGKVEELGVGYLKEESKPLEFLKKKRNSLLVGTVCGEVFPRWGLINRFPVYLPAQILACGGSQ
jgi:hypothetical protein